MGIVQWDQVFFNNVFSFLDGLSRRGLLPEPIDVDGDTGLGRQIVCFFGDFLSGILFVMLHVGIKQLIGRVFPGIVLTDQTVGLQ